MVVSISEKEFGGVAAEGGGIENLVAALPDQQCARRLRQQKQERYMGPRTGPNDPGEQWRSCYKKGLQRETVQVYHDNLAR